MTPFLDLAHAEDYGTRVLAAIPDCHHPYDRSPHRHCDDRATVRDCLDGLRVSARLLTVRVETDELNHAARYAAILHRIGTTYGESP